MKYSISSGALTLNFGLLSSSLPQSSFSLTFWLALVCFYLCLVLVLVLVLYNSVTSHYLLSIYLFHALFAWLSFSHFFGIALERMLLISLPFLLIGTGCYSSLSLWLCLGFCSLLNYLHTYIPRIYCRIYFATQSSPITN